MYHSRYYGTPDSEKEHLAFLDWLDLYCADPWEAKRDEWYLSKSKDERIDLIRDGRDERNRRKNDGVC